MGRGAQIGGKGLIAFRGRVRTIQLKSLQGGVSLQSHVSCHRVNSIFGLAKLLKFETYECWSTVRRIVFAGMHLNVCIL